MSSPQTRMLKEKYPGHLTSTELSHVIDKSRETIARWRKLGYLVPSVEARTGTTVVWLYTPDDVKRALKLTRKIRPGKQTEVQA